MAENERDYSPESRAVKMVSSDVKKVIEHFRGYRKSGFMEAKRSRSTERMHAAITGSPVGSRLLAEGYPVAFAYRVAKLEKQQLVVPKLPDQGIAAALLSSMEDGGPPQPDPEAVKNAHIESVFEMDRIRTLNSQRDDPREPRADLFRPEVELDATQVEDRRWMGDAREPQPSPPPPRRYR